MRPVSLWINLPLFLKALGPFSGAPCTKAQVLLQVAQHPGHWKTRGLAELMVCYGWSGKAGALKCLQACGGRASLHLDLHVLPQRAWASSPSNHGCRPRTKPWEEMGCGRWSSCPRGSQSFWCSRFYRDISIRQLRAGFSRSVEDGCDHLWCNQNSDDSSEQLHSRNHNLFYRSV